MPLTTLLVGFIGLQTQSCMPPPSVGVKGLPADTMIADIGTSDLSITTTSEKARALVKQGFALRHCFWFNESLRSFRDATKADPKCAIAWLGVHAAITNPWYRLSGADKEAEYAITQAVALSGSASAVETGLIAAFRAESIRNDDDTLIRALESLVARHGEVNELKLLLSGHLIQVKLGTYDEKGNPFGEFRRARELAQAVLAKDGDNPGAHHYIIHALEGSSEPGRALSSADRLGKSARASSHMVHMPGHIYFRVGDYAKAEEVFARSAAIDEKYAIDIKGDKYSNWNYLHNQRFRYANLLEAGRFAEARSLIPKIGDLTLDQDRRWRSNDWAGFDAKFWKSPEDAPMRAMAALSLNDLVTATAEIDKVVTLAKDARKDGDGTWTRILEALASELKGRLLSAEGKHDEALKLLEDACQKHGTIAYDEPPDYVAPPEEALGYACIRAKKFPEARKAFERALKRRPHSGFPLLGLARTDVAEGVSARKAYEKLLSEWSKADAEHSIIKEAKAYLAANR